MMIKSRDETAHFVLDMVYNDLVSNTEHSMQKGRVLPHESDT